MVKKAMLQRASRFFEIGNGTGSHDTIHHSPFAIHRDAKGGAP
jgi:hypothetical protein